MTGHKGVVAAGHRVSAEAAAEILQDGGNAFDAALAALWTACVPEVVFASIGGGGFLMASVPERRRTVLYDFFAETPGRKVPEAELDFYAIQADFGPVTQEFHIGAASTATPGFVQGLFAVHAELCRLPMRRIAEPAVRAAREGVAMSELHAYLFTIIAPILTASAGARAIFAPGGDLLKAGETYRNPDIGDTIEAIAAEGPRLYTEGEVARAMVAQSETQGGMLTMEDLKAYEVIRRQPLIWRHRETDIALNPAPAAGGALIAFGLGLLERLRPDGAPPSPLELARVMAETNHVRAARGAALEDIARAPTIARHFEAMAGHTPATRGTTHVSVIDADGNTASATVSNGEGNGLIVEGLGFMLNNMLGEEDLNPDGFHLWAPNTRLSSMMAPTVLNGSDGSVTAMGSGGSNRIRTAILQVAVDVIDRGLELEQAVTAPRLHVEKTGVVSFEDFFADADREAVLEAYPDADVWSERNLFFGGVHAARRHGDGGFEGAGDPRRDGVAMVV